MLKKICFASVLQVSLALLPNTAIASRVIDEVPLYSDLSVARLSSQQCMAVNLYHESRSESDIANMMVLATVMNRVESWRFPDDICEVVFADKAFSWTSDNISDEIKNTNQYKRLYKLTVEFLLNKKTYMKISNGSDHYHSVNVNPYWSRDKDMKYIMTVDNHKFYKFK